MLAYLALLEYLGNTRWNYFCFYHILQFVNFALMVYQYCQRSICTQRNSAFNDHLLRQSNQVAMREKSVELSTLTNLLIKNINARSRGIKLLMGTLKKTIYEKNFIIYAPFELASSIDLMYSIFFFLLIISEQNT